MLLSTVCFTGSLPVPGPGGDVLFSSSLTARWKCWLPGCSSKPYCLQHWCVFLSSVTSSRLTAAANLYLTQTLTASRETGREGAAPLERVNSATGRGQVGLIYKWGAELGWGVFVCERVSTYDELVSTVSGWPGRREIITGPAGVCESPSPELPVFVPDTRSPWTWRVSPTKPNWNFSSSRLGWLGQAGPARSKWENILLQSIFFLSEERNATIFLCSRESISQCSLQDSPELEIKCNNYQIIMFY